MASDYQYELTDIALQDIDHIVAYIVRQLFNPAAVASLTDALTEKLEMLCGQPDMGTPVRNKYVMRDDIRKLFIKNLVVYYFPDHEAQKIIVIRIGHSLQDQLRLLKEICGAPKS